MSHQSLPPQMFSPSTTNNVVPILVSDDDGVPPPFMLTPSMATGAGNDSCSETDDIVCTQGDVRNIFSTLRVDDAYPSQQHLRPCFSCGEHSVDDGYTSVTTTTDRQSCGLSISRCTTASATTTTTTTMDGANQNHHTTFFTPTVGAQNVASSCPSATDQLEPSIDEEASPATTHSTNHTGAPGISDLSEQLLQYSPPKEATPVNITDPSGVRGEDAEVYKAFSMPRSSRIHTDLSPEATAAMTSIRSMSPAGCKNLLADFTEMEDAPPSLILASTTASPVFEYYNPASPLPAVMAQSAHTAATNEDLAPNSIDEDLDDYYDDYVDSDDLVCDEFDDLNVLELQAALPPPPSTLPCASEHVSTLDNFLSPQVSILPTPSPLESNSAASFGVTDLLLHQLAAEFPHFVDITSPSGNVLSFSWDLEDGSASSAVATVEVFFPTRIHSPFANLVFFTIDDGAVTGASMDLLRELDDFVTSGSYTANFTSISTMMTDVIAKVAAMV